MGFAAALSEHPLATQATGEILGTLLERVGRHPDLVTVFATGAHAGALQDIAGAVAEVLQPIALVGCAAESVIGPHHEVERSPGVAVLAGTVGPLLPLALATHAAASGHAAGRRRAPVLGADRDDAVPDADDDVVVDGWPEHVPFEPRTLLLVADPFTFATGPFLAWLDRHHPGVTVVGGMASGARGPGAARLAVGSAVLDRGAVGVLLGPSVTVTGAVSPGSRAFGDPLVVTAATGNVITALSGRPPLDCLVRQAAASLTPDEADRLGDGGLQLGRTVDRHPGSRGPEVLVHAVLGADRGSGAIAVDGAVPVGATVRFHVRDATAADAGLRRALVGRQAEAALVFTCRGRGTRLFDARDHDVAAVASALGPVPVAGFFADGEIGPVGGRNAVHRSSAAVALLSEGPSQGPTDPSARPGTGGAAGP